MPRTTPTRVAACLGDNYGEAADGTLQPSLTTWIAMACVMVDKTVVWAATRNQTLDGTQVGVGHTANGADEDTQLELIEQALAAHYYTKMDPVFTSKTTGKASASFVRGKEEAEPYKDMAIGLDTSGCLNALLNRKVAEARWLGKVPSAQIPYQDRS